MRRGASFCASDPVEPGLGPLWETVADAMKRGIPTSISIVNQKRAKLATDHSADIERLKPLVIELAHRTGAAGITAGDIRMVAERRGLLERGSGRSLSWLTILPRACGLVNTGRRRMSPLLRSRNDHVIYCLPEFGPRVGGVRGT